MARALQCPDCGNRHRLDGVAHLRTFRCDECGRLLKVPASVAAGKAGARGSGAKAQAGGARSDASADTSAMGEPTTASPGAAANGKTKRVPPSQRKEAVIERGRDSARLPMPGQAGAPPVPRLVRGAIWLAALPVGLVPVLVLGRLTGLLSVDRAVDVFVGVGLGRFVPLLLTAIPWALATATVAHFAIEGVERLREGRATPGSLP